MNRRLAVLVAAASVVAVGVPGHAAVKAKPKPKPSCLMITDPTGDAKIQGQGSSYAADDVVSGDLATGRTNLVGVLRLKSGSSADGLPTGDTYTLSWTQTQKGKDGKTATTKPKLALYVYATGEIKGTFQADTTPGVTTPEVPATQAGLDSTGVITWVVTRKLAGLMPGVKFSSLGASSRIAMNYHFGGGDGRGAYVAMDDALGHASYTDLQASCVRAQ